MFLQSSKNFTYVVSYLNGVLSLEETTRVTGKEIFARVCSCLGVTEYWYFGIQYGRQGHWLRPNSRVCRLVRRSGGPLTFLVKYFPDDVDRVSEKITISLIYEQAKASVVSGAVQCPPETSLLLASYSLQAEVGDWPCVDYSSLTAGEVVPPETLESPRRSWSDTLRVWHRDHEGLGPDEARIHYLRTVQYLGMYGVSYFPGKFEGANSWLGVHPRGINLYGDNRLVPKTSFKWTSIRLVHYSCRKFFVKTILSQAPEIVFHLKNLRVTRQLFEFAVGYHHLYLRTHSLDQILVQQVRPRPTTTTSSSLDSNAEKFKETTEENYSNETAHKSRFVFSKKFAKKFSHASELPAVTEEEENLISA